MSSKHAASNKHLSFEGGGVRPLNVGILGIEVYFPSTYVSQTDLEAANGVAKGKYTIGLGQKGMAVTGDREDVNSIALTAVAGLLEKYNINTADVGRLEIGTESLIDKSKSSKTVVMSLFEGNTDIEGCTTINACYGGTAALLNAFAWVESSAWDGRYAIVVAADIAVYADGPARPTGGLGAVAVLIGADAPLVMNPRCRTSHACDVWDFYKPDMDSEYPRVDGGLSQTCYLQALDDCYGRFATKKEALGEAEVFSLKSSPYYIFHSPYNKLIQKAFGRLFFCDAKRDVEAGRPLSSTLKPLEKWTKMPLEDTYADKELENVLKKLSAQAYSVHVAPSSTLSQAIGNTYAASVFMGIACLVDTIGAELEGKTAFVFSYGSGALATMYELRARRPTTPAGAAFTLERMSNILSLPERLAAREKLPPAEVNAALESRAAAHSAAPFNPIYPVDRLFPGTFYLETVGSEAVRRYGRVPHDAVRATGGPMVPCSVDMGEASSWTTTETEHTNGLVEERPNIMLPGAVSPNLALLQPVVVTGIACGLPGQPDVFTPDNISNLMAGKNCLQPLSDASKHALIEKSVIQLKKNGAGQAPTRVRITDPSETIQIAARLGNLDLTKYGVSHSISSCMDKAVQVAVAAGLEALLDAGIVKGGSDDPAAWKLPEHMRDTTGVVYATSFPALDAAVGEAMRFLKSRCVTRAKKGKLIAALRERLRQNAVGGEIYHEDEESLRNLEKAMVTKSFMNLRVAETEALEAPEEEEYEFDRKFLFRVLVLGNAQLAQIVGARGPNMQTNAACAGSTQAMAMAQDMMSVGRADRMIVIAGDDAAGDSLLPWIGNGFRALGAASIASTAAEAALPFDIRRNGMLLGSGAIGMVLETEGAYASRTGPGRTPSVYPNRLDPRLLETQISNSCYHGAGMDREHIALEMERFLTTVHKRHGITKEEIATSGVYFSHETCTHASATLSCAYNEIWGLRQVFGDLLDQLVIINTKAFTGHAMGVSFEDIAAIEVLRSGKLPPTPNTKTIDPILGKLRLSPGGSFPAKYALRFAAGFGSQVGLSLFVWGGAPRTVSYHSVIN